MENLTKKQIAQVKAIEEFISNWGGVADMRKALCAAETELLTLVRNADVDVWALHSVIGICQMHGLILDLFDSKESTCPV